jgi:hypothetical protein
VRVNDAEPTRNCPHCRAQSQTAAKRCPHCRKKFKKRSPLATLAIIIVVISALGIAGCGLLIGGAAVAVDEAVKAEEAKGITKAQFDAVAARSSRADVESALGEPSSEYESEFDQAEMAKITGGAETSQHECVYYSKQGQVGGLFQFCFQDGVMQSKSAY